MSPLDPKYLFSSFSGSILGAITEGVFTVDRDLQITSFNRSAENIIGVKAEDAIGRKCQEVFPSDLCESSCVIKIAMATGGEVIKHGVKVLTRVGKLLPINVTGSVLHNGQGEIVGGVVTFRDVSALEDLRKELFLDEFILDSIADGAFTVDKDFLITFFNRAAEDITGVGRCDAVGKKCYEVLRATDCVLKKSIETGINVVNHKVYIQNSEDIFLPISVSTSVLRNERNEIIGGVETFRDISIQEVLRKEVSLGELILDSIADGAFTVDKDFKITSFNRAAEDLTGTHRSEAIGRKCHEVFRADICQTTCALKKSIETGMDVFNLKVYILNAEDDIIPISVSTSALRDERGRIIGGVETFRDISAMEILRKKINEDYSFQDIISKNHKVRNIFSTLPDIAKSVSTVLIEGPSGSGKELFAKAIHGLSKRKGRYVALNCGALPDTLLESELFGYQKGAFTDAKSDKAGRFALAEKGTIFLDEIGDISPALQLKLLRVLQEKEFEPLGGTTTRKTDVRVIAATNKNLKEQVEKGTFRADLFYRINVIRISLPPLTERREDIPLLADHFIKKFNILKHKNIKNLSPDVLGILMRHDYPGNVRELENIIEYCFVLCHGETIDKYHLPEGLIPEMAEEEAVPHENLRIEANPLLNAESSTIFEALQRFKGHRGKAAAYLGIEKTTLWRKMKKFNISFSADHN